MLASAARRAAPSRTRRPWRPAGRRDSPGRRQRSPRLLLPVFSGENCGCLSSSVRRAPRLSRRCVAASRSEPNWAKAAISRYCAELALERAGNLLHRLDLGVATHARHRDTDVHRRADALEEEVGLEEDLAVGDRDHVGRNIGRHVVGLRLDDGQRGERARAVVFVELGGALEQAASGGRTRRPDRLRGPADGAAAATSGGRRRPAW